MYSHISKGFTLGHVLTRRTLRSLTSIPGIALDLLAAMFWAPHYSSYWDNKVYYGDGTANGFFEGIFGWIGEAIGYPVGALVGMIAGLAVYFPDLILRGAFWLYNKAGEGLTNFAKIVGEREFFSDYTFNNPTNYMQKAWNISAATLGTLIATPLYIIPRAVEFVFPFLGNTASRFMWNVGATVGGAIGGSIAAITYPAKYLTDRLADGFKVLRNGMRSLTAFVYAKGNQNLYSSNNGQDCCIPDNTMHSQKFRNKYGEYVNTSTTEILFGKLRANDNEDERQHLVAPSKDGDDELLDDPISHTKLVDPVIDRHGHTFSRSTITSWLKKDPTCPISREPMGENDLVPNRMVDDMLKRGQAKV